MKKILIILIILISGCRSEEISKYPLRVETSNGSGWNLGTAIILVDSVQMISTKKAEIFKDGTKMIIEAENYLKVYENR